MVAVAARAYRWTLPLALARHAHFRLGMTFPTTLSARAAATTADPASTAQADRALTRLAAAADRVAVLSRATLDAVDLACATMLRLGRAASNDVLLFWFEPGDSIHVERMWSRERIDDWLAQQRAAIEQAARSRLAELGARATVICGVCDTRQLGLLVEDAGADLVVLPRPRSDLTPAGHDWWAIHLTLRDVARPVLIV
jgi:hypothetical protein